MNSFLYYQYIPVVPMPSQGQKAYNGYRLKRIQLEGNLLRICSVTSYFKSLIKISSAENPDFQTTFLRHLTLFR